MLAPAGRDPFRRDLDRHAYRCADRRDGRHPNRTEAAFESPTGGRSHRRGDATARPDRLANPYSAVELDQILAVLGKLLAVQRLVLTVNQAYIASASQADASRTEPPFRLQGSYRNMNALAARIVAVMNDAELEAVIDDHYLGEAQTLTSGAEANLLKLAELRGRLSPAQAVRWAEVKAAYVKTVALGGDGDDPVSRAVGAAGLLADRVGAVESAIDRVAARLARRERP